MDDNDVVGLIPPQPIRPSSAVTAVIAATLVVAYGAPCHTHAAAHAYAMPSAAKPLLSRHHDIMNTRCVTRATPTMKCCGYAWRCQTIAVRQAERGLSREICFTSLPRCVAHDDNEWQYATVTEMKLFATTHAVHLSHPLPNLHPHSHVCQNSKPGQRKEEGYGVGDRNGWERQWHRVNSSGGGEEKRKNRRTRQEGRHKERPCHAKGVKC